MQLEGGNEYFVLLKQLSETHMGNCCVKLITATLQRVVR